MSTAAAETTRRRRWYRRPEMILAGLGALLLGIAALSFIGGQSSPQAVEPSPPVATSTTSQPSAPTSSSGPVTSSAPATTSRPSSTSTTGSDKGWGDKQHLQEAKEAGKGAPAQAEKVMRLLASAKSLGRETWWSRTEPLLSEQGRTEMVGINPEMVPFRKVTGKAHLLVNDDTGGDDGHAGEEVTVLVPTDVGRWTVIVSADPGDGTWKVSSLRAPEGVH